MGSPMSRRGALATLLGECNSPGASFAHRRVQGDPRGPGGPRQANDPNAMPLEHFIAETMNIPKTSPGLTEICVERVKRLRFAEANGGYDVFFKKFNDAFAAAAAREPYALAPAKHRILPKRLPKRPSKRLTRL